ncbi:MAG: hypothetical protein ACP5UV_00835 [Thermoplasmata archaeon]
MFLYVAERSILSIANDTLFSCTQFPAFFTNEVEFMDNHHSLSAFGEVI